MPPIRRASLLSRYEDAVVNGQPAYPLGYDEEDEDEVYDVYLFWPSTAPHLLVPEDFLQDALLETSSTTATSRRSEPYDELYQATPTVSTSTAELDYNVSEDDTTSSMGRAGYSRFFTEGFIQTSRQVTQQLDGAIRNFRRAFTWLRWFGRQS